jgi:cytochrome c biogenesis protein CcmG/thiol:disulfide interchange protein DsbE
MILMFGLIFPGCSLTAQMVYNIELSDMDGNNLRVGDIKGNKLTVLDFWATWCRPCINSIPQFVKLSEKYKEQGVSFIGVNEDSPRNLSKVRPFALSLGITYPILLDTDQQLLSNFMIDGFPTLIILDKTGKVLFTHLGYVNGDEVIIGDKIDELLSKMD